jgi:hypothetical protein
MPKSSIECHFAQVRYDRLFDVVLPRDFAIFVRTAELDKDERSATLAAVPQRPDLDSAEPRGILGREERHSFGP